MPKLIGYSKASFLNPLISWLYRNKPNIKYTLKAEYVKNGRKYEADCGAITSDPIISVLYDLLSNSIYSTGKGVTNPTVSVFTTANGNTNVNASTSWLSTSYNFGYPTSGYFTLNFSTTISSAVTSTTTVNLLLITFNYGQDSSGTPYAFQLFINTQEGNACNISIDSGSVINWTLSGSVSESNSNAGASWYVYLWNEIWAEFIAATGVSGAPTGLFQYPTAGTALFKSYEIEIIGNNNIVIGAYNVPGTSNTAISNPSISPGSNSGLLSAPNVSFTFTPTSDNTIQDIISIVYLNGTIPSSPTTQLASSGFLELRINNINQPVGSSEQYTIIFTDNISVSGNT